MDNIPLLGRCESSLIDSTGMFATSTGADFVRIKCVTGSSLKQCTRKAAFSLVGALSKMTPLVGMNVF